MPEAICDSVSFNSVSEEFDATAVDESEAACYYAQNLNLEYAVSSRISTPSGEIMLRNWVRYLKVKRFANQHFVVSKH
ncbi:MAG: hypothetical protein R2850_05635 [Bacteroidia bacterium]